jgi:hypothetical protein
MSDDTSRAQELALLNLLNQVWHDPEVGAQVRKRAKALNPQINIPDEHPVALEVKSELSATQKRLEAMEKMYQEEREKATQREMETDLRSRLGKAQDRFKLTDDGLQGTIKLMQERQISDPEAAAALYVDSLPKSKPSTASSNIFPGEFNLFGTKAKDDNWEKLHTNPDNFFRDVVNDVFREMPVAG